MYISYSRQVNVISWQKTYRGDDANITSQSLDSMETGDETEREVALGIHLDSEKKMEIWN